MSTLLLYTGLPSSILPGGVLPAYGAGRVRARLEYEQLISLPRPGRCPDLPVHLIAAIDSSASVLGGKDPIGMRFIELHAALRRLARRCKCNAELVSIVHFDTPVHNDLLAAKLTNSDAIEKALRIPYDGAGCSLLGPSLSTARRLSLSHPRHRTVLVALTDFQLFDPTHIWNDFTEFPGEIHACILGGGYRGFDDDPRVTVTSITRQDPPGAVARAVLGALTAASTEAPKNIPSLRIVKE